jgi:3-oxoacyl-[acyl-carrier protein] reductase
MSVAGKTAIVTGAGTGIGRATAQLLAERGARVVVAGLQPDKLKETVAAITEAGGVAVAAHADVSDPEAIEDVAARAEQAFGGTDVLVNNAGVYPLGPWHEMSAEQFDEVFHVNVRGYQLLAQAVRPQMLARGGGAIVNVASVTFWTGMGLLSTYIASKGAVIVAPGAFPTAATDIHADQDKLWREVMEAQSIKRRGEVEDVAKAIAFFASDESSFVTGQTLLVDGGWMFG